MTQTLGRSATLVGFLLLTLAIVLSALPAGSFAATPSPPFIDEEPRITLTELRAFTGAKEERDLLEIGLSVTNPNPVDRWSVRLRIPRAIAETRSGLAQQNFSAVDVVDVVGTTELGDEAGSVLVQLRGADAKLRGLGARKVQAEFRGDGKVLATTSFFLSSFIGPTYRPTPITVLWPLIDRPRRDLEGNFLDDGLAMLFSPEGRLARLVNAGAGTDVVWVIDPELLEAAAAMSTGYSVYSEGVLSAGENGPLAASWLESVRLATAGREVIVLPFADPDIATITTANLGRELRQQRIDGLQIASEVLQRPASSLISYVAWPNEQRSRPEIVQNLATAGFTHMITDSSEYPALDGAIATPRARMAPRAGITPLVADVVIGRALLTNSIEGFSRARAEICMITAERPSDPRPQLILPPRDWDPVTGVADLLLRLPSSALSPLSALISSEISERGLPLNSAETLAPVHLSSYQGVKNRIAVITDVVGEESAFVTQAQRQSRGALSTVWHHQRTAASSYVAVINAGGAQLSSRLRVLSGRYTLTGKDQSIPITIANDFDLPVVLSLSVVPRSPRVRINSPTEVTIAAGSRSQILLPITAVATGQVILDAQIYGPGGRRYGEPVALAVDVRNIGPIANWILGGSTLLLAIAVALRLWRRVRRSKVSADE
jgi:hypothetical protein